MNKFDLVLYSWFNILITQTHLKKPLKYNLVLNIYDGMLHFCYSHKTVQFIVFPNLRIYKFNLYFLNHEYKERI